MAVVVGFYCSVIGCDPARQGVRHGEPVDNREMEVGVANEG